MIIVQQGPEDGEGDDKGQEGQDSTWESEGGIPQGSIYVLGGILVHVSGTIAFFRDMHAT